MAIVSNPSVDSAANWDSVGKQKLTKLAQNVIDAFPTTPIGQDIIDRIDALEADVFKRLGRDVVFCQIGDEDDASQLQITLNAVSAEDVDDGYFNTFFIDGAVYIHTNAQELNFGVSLDTDVPVVTSSGVSVVERYTGSELVDSTIFSEAMGFPNQLVSTDNTISDVVFKFSASVTLAASTDTDLFVDLTGDATGAGSVLAGCYISARVQAPAPIAPPDPPIP